LHIYRLIRERRLGPIELAFLGEYCHDSYRSNCGAVIACERVACDVVSLRLVSDAPELSLSAFEAGAHIDLHLRDGLTRKYSLCNDPFERGVYEIAIKREPPSRGGSAVGSDRFKLSRMLTLEPSLPFATGRFGKSWRN
jgi:ferredoxin-NADP reductase